MDAAHRQQGCDNAEGKCGPSLGRWISPRLSKGWDCCEDIGDQQQDNGEISPLGDNVDTRTDEADRCTKPIELRDLPRSGVTLGARNENCNRSETKGQSDDGGGPYVKMELDNEGNEWDETPKKPGDAMWRRVATERVSNVGNEPEHADGRADVDEPSWEHVGSLSWCSLGGGGMKPRPRN